MAIRKKEFRIRFWKLKVHARSSSYEMSTSETSYFVELSLENMRQLLTQ